MTFRDLIKKYREECENNYVPEETALLYLVELSQESSFNLYMRYDEEVDSAFLKKYEDGMARILKHEPVQHVIGYSWFYGYKFLVNKDVLIPRPETEELVSCILNRLDEKFKNNKEITLVDIGTGSGAIAISLSKEEKKLRVLASDISKEALKIAKENAKINEADVEFLWGSMVEPFIENKIKTDIIVCNPPYIPSNEVLEDFVYDHEPHLALFGGEDGLKFYRILFENCHKILNEKGFIACEIGYNQGEEISNLVKSLLPNTDFEIIKDINNKDRMLFIYFK